MTIREAHTEACKRLGRSEDHIEALHKIAGVATPVIADSLDLEITFAPDMDAEKLIEMIRCSLLCHQWKN